MRKMVFHMDHCSVPLATTKPENQWQLPEVTYKFEAKYELTFTHCTGGQPECQAAGSGTEFLYASTCACDIIHYSRFLI